jgi:hypothetical protein
MHFAFSSFMKEIRLVLSTYYYYYLNAFCSSLTLEVILKGSSFGLDAYIRNYSNLCFPIIPLQTSKSDAHSVYLKSVRHEQTGVYKCEVSADAPFFDTDVVLAQMTVVGEYM